MRSNLDRSNIGLTALDPDIRPYCGKSDRLLSLIHSFGQMPNNCLGGIDRKVGADGQEWTLRQIQVLDAIARHSGASQILVTQYTGIDRSTLCEMLKRLASRGLVVRTRSRSDRRSHRLYLTEGGRKVLQDGRAALDDLEKSVLKRLSVNEVEVFIDLLGKVVGVNVPVSVELLAGRAALVEL